MRDDYSLKRNISWLLTALMIFIAIVAGGCRLLVDKKGSIEDVFYSGVQKDGASISSDLKYRAEYAAKLSREAEKYLPSDSLLAEDVARAAASLEKAENIHDMYIKNTELNEKITLLRMWAEGEGIFEKGSADALYFKELFVDIESRNQTISHDPYNDMVREYNSLLVRFPYNIYKKIIDIGELELFGK